jgi:uncharacterized membrane protein YfcA
LAFICEIIGTVGGFGSSFIFVPLAQFFWSVHLVLALTSALHIFSNTAKLILFRKTINWKITLLMGIPSLLFTIIGAMLIKYVPATIAQWTLALLLIVFSGLLLIFSKFQLKPTNVNAIVGGGLSGFFAGFTGTGGAIRGLSMAAFNLEKNFFVGTSAAIDFSVDVSRFFIYFKSGFFDKNYYGYIPLLIVASFVGSYIGKILLSKLEQQTFKTTVLLIISGIGVTMLFNLIKNI